MSKRNAINKWLADWWVVPVTVFSLIIIFGSGFVVDSTINQPYENEYRGHIKNAVAAGTPEMVIQEFELAKEGITN